MSQFFNVEKIIPWIDFLASGLGITLLIAFLAAIFGLVIGVVLSIMQSHKGFQKIAYIYIDIFRGTPIILQLSIIYFAVPQLVNAFLKTIGSSQTFLIAALPAALIAFSLNSAAYLSEVIRSGINSVDKGEIEAAVSLGLKKWHIYKDVILPTAFRNSFPALMNELITLIKESSIVSIIGIQDLMRRSNIVTAQTYLYLEPLIVIGIIYYVVIKILTILSRKLEMRLQYD